VIMSRTLSQGMESLSSESLVIFYDQTAVYDPQANGILERCHRSLCEGLLHYVIACGNNWETIVPLYLMAYRNTPHGINKYSPF
jgi:hypothetical protein